MQHRFAFAIVSIGAASVVAPAHAEPILPPSDPALDTLRAGYDVAEDNFVTRENGLHLDPVVKPEDVAAVEAFFAQSAVTDFEAFDGRHPFEVLADYDEHGDEGNFAGIASVGIAARL